MTLSHIAVSAGSLTFDLSFRLVPRLVDARREAFRDGVDARLGFRHACGGFELEKELQEPASHGTPNEGLKFRKFLPGLQALEWQRQSVKVFAMNPRRSKVVVAPQEEEKDPCPLLTIH
jgi:hypothetical protein